LVEFEYARLDAEPVASLPEQVVEHFKGPPKLARLLRYEMLCGMFVGHYSDDAVAEGVVSRYGVGVMVRSQEIREALMSDIVSAERRERDKTLGSDTHPIVRSAANPS